MHTDLGLIATTVYQTSVPGPPLLLDSEAEGVSGLAPRNGRAPALLKPPSSYHSWVKMLVSSGKVSL